MWIPIALSRDVPAETTRSVLLAGLERVLWRGAGGSVQLWEDRCPHRGMRLSLGFVRGERLACLYHGWEYATDAGCRRIPAHPDLVVPPSIRARAFTVAEGGGMIWTSATDVAMPPLAAAAPVASMAVPGAAADVLAALAGVALAGLQQVEVRLGADAALIGWHETGMGRTMLHAVAPAGTDRRAILGALRAVRDQFAGVHA